MKAEKHLAAYQERLAQGKTREESISALFQELLTEAHRTALQRSGRPRPHDGVMLPAIREQDAKWRKIAPALDLNPEGFKAVLAEKGIHL